MNNYVKKISVVLLMLVCMSHQGVAQSKKRKANKDTKEWRYDLSCEGIAKQGSKLVKVWSYSKSPKFAIAQAKKNAVHGIIFKGFAGGGAGCTSFKPLYDEPSIKEDHEAFFELLFKDGGAYMKYVSSATDGNIAAGDRLKISKKEYKIGLVVDVLTDQLRKKLEAEGIIKGLNSGF